MPVEKLLEILCCPACRGGLIYDVKLSELHCLKCMLAYAVKDDIPVMLIDEARRLSDADVKNVEKRPVNKDGSE